MNKIGETFEIKVFNAEKVQEASASPNIKAKVLKIFEDYKEIREKQRAEKRISNAYLIEDDGAIKRCEMDVLYRALKMSSSGKSEQEIIEFAQHRCNALENERENSDKKNGYLPQREIITKEIEDQRHELNNLDW